MAKFTVGTINNIPANTGKDKSNNTAVTNIAHTNNGTLCKDIPFAFILNTVEMKLIAPKSEDTPAKCKENIVRSTDAPECDCTPAKGG